MTTPTTASRPLRHLPNTPDGTSWTARENLTQLLRHELLGPVDGETELIPEAPANLYVLGRIAPQRLVGEGQPTTEGTEDDLPQGEANEVTQHDGVPLETDDDDPAGRDDEGADDQPQRRGLMIPASMGLRCQVPLELERITITTSWGTYASEKTEEVTATGRPIRAFRRTQHRESIQVPLAELSPARTWQGRVDDGHTMVRIDTRVLGGKRILEIALCNDRETGPHIPSDAWLFQTHLVVETDGPQADFLPVVDPVLEDYPEEDAELRRLNLQYRDRLEFAVGRTCSVTWTTPELPGDEMAGDEVQRRALTVETTWLPQSETPQTKALNLPGALLDMTKLGTATADEIRLGLQPIVDGYQSWLNGDQTTKLATLPDHLRPEGAEAIREARVVAKQLADGLDFLLSDAQALRAFGFMNRVMADQRIQSQVSELRHRDPSINLADATHRVTHNEDGSERPEAHSWRPFQLAFILMQLPALCRPTEPLRSGNVASVELLFFPTGGGKTEAYLGLAAFTFAIRRLQGRVQTPEGVLDGTDGVGVLMRYTLRLLTSQQFQRATTLVCAAERERLSDPATWGAVPFRIGLWVGSGVSPKWVNDARQQLNRVTQGEGGELTVLQIRRCPWCGSRITPDDVSITPKEDRVRVFCPNWRDRCPFAKAPRAPRGEGIPVLTTDEEIYRLVPAFVVATVDKFARLAREGQAAALFGQVARRCERHGYKHLDSSCDIETQHQADPTTNLPIARVVPADRLRPPDLVIQDELHLITSSLGTTVGLFEVAIDTLCSWESADGPVRPLVVASSATVRNAVDQIQQLYGRRTTIFPPQVLTAGDSWFSSEVPITRETPGRRYIGVSTTGVRFTSAERRIATVLLQVGQLLLDSEPAGEEPSPVDPYLTMVGYYNAIRELAGMKRYLVTDVQTGILQPRRNSGLPRRTGTNFGTLNIAELTSRYSGRDITDTLDRMDATFDPARDSSEGRREVASGELGRRDTNPYDVVLATSMLQVGVDVSRLGLMLVAGQPKNTAEYIQASSRVGRDAERPGLVVMLSNWSRPRDLAHFEQFEHYHHTFYQRVEALSVTPFSTTNIDRGAVGLLIAAARVSQARLATGRDAAHNLGVSPDHNANQVAEQYQALSELVERLVRRAAEANSEQEQTVRLRLQAVLDEWLHQQQDAHRNGQHLVYERAREGTNQRPLMISSEASSLDSAIFRVPNSMREVQPEVNVLVSPVRIAVERQASDPEWQMPDLEEE